MMARRVLAQRTQIPQLRGSLRGGSPGGPLVLALEGQDLLVREESLNQSNFQTIQNNIENTSTYLTKYRNNTGNTFKTPDAI